MPETVTLAVPVQTDPGATSFRVVILLLDFAGAIVQVTLRDWTGAAFGGHTLVVTYTGAEATALMTALNTANLSTKSLHKRVIEKLQADGKLGAGAIAGTPE